MCAPAVKGVETGTGEEMIDPDELAVQIPCGGHCRGGAGGGRDVSFKENGNSLEILKTCTPERNAT